MLWEVFKGNSFWYTVKVFCEKFIIFFKLVHQNALSVYTRFYRLILPETEYLITMLVKIDFVFFDVQRFLRFFRGRGFFRWAAAQAPTGTDRQRPVRTGSDRHGLAWTVRWPSRNFIVRLLVNFLRLNTKKPINFVILFKKCLSFPQLEMSTLTWK